MIPSWSDAPEWAKFLAQDRSGRWYWYETRPTYLEYSGTWTVIDESRVRIAHEVNENSAHTLLERPA